MHEGYTAGGKVMDAIRGKRFNANLFLYEKFRQLRQIKVIKNPPFLGGNGKSIPIWPLAQNFMTNCRNILARRFVYTGAARYQAVPGKI
jgi:hypothetical protein